MNSNFLRKKIPWFNENKFSKQKREFGFRFPGKKNYNYLKGFPMLILMLKLFDTSLFKFIMNRCVFASLFHIQF